MRKWLTGLFAGSVLLVAADTVAWFGATQLLSRGIDRWSGELRRQGWAVRDSGKSRFGWPFSAAVAVNDFRIAGGARVLPGGLTWQAGRVVVSVSLASPATLCVAPEGQEYLRVLNLPTVVFTADRILATMSVFNPSAGDLAADGITGGLLGSGHPQDVQVEQVAVHAAAQLGDNKPPTGVHAREGGGLQALLELRVSGIQLPDSGKWPLGATVARAGGIVGVTSPSLPDLGQDIAQQAVAWRQGGGAVTLRDVALRWGPLTLHGAAQLGLDSRLQPSGSGTADVGGTAAALDALVDAGLVQPGMGVTAKAVLGAMAQLPADGAVRLPFVLRDNTISVGQIPLARLNDVVW